MVKVLQLSDNCLGVKTQTGRRQGHTLGINEGGEEEGSKAVLWQHEQKKTQT